jgi:hypothetical protein
VNCSVFVNHNVVGQCFEKCGFASVVISRDTFSGAFFLDVLWGRVIDQLRKRHRVLGLALNFNEIKRVAFRNRGRLWVWSGEVLLQFFSLGYRSVNYVFSFRPMAFNQVVLGRYKRTFMRGVKHVT